MITQREHDKESCQLAALRARLADPSDQGVYSREEVAALLSAHAALGKRLDRIVKISDGYQYEMKEMADELHQALANVKTLKGLIPICASCKKIRTGEGYWRQIEQYIRENSEASLSHGLCPECATNYMQLASTTNAAESISQPSAVKVSEIDLENPVISHYINILNNKDFNDTPLRGDLLRLLEKYILLEKRQRRIVRISDKYHCEVKEIKEKFEHEARIDYLTGLANRREMYRVMHAEIARTKRHGGNISLIMFDYDNFKSINDAYGHEAGDLILQHGAQLLSKVLRQEDTCARWGGEEFMLIQPGNDRDGLLRSAERLRLTIEQHPLKYKGITIETTISVGVALYNSGESLNNLIFRVDSSLYGAKKSGKNQVGPLEAQVAKSELGSQ